MSSRDDSRFGSSPPSHSLLPPSENYIYLREDQERKKENKKRRSRERYTQIGEGGGRRE